MCKTHRPSSFSSSSVHGDISNSFALPQRQPGRAVVRREALTGDEDAGYSMDIWVHWGRDYYVSPGTCMHAMACQWRSEDNFQNWFSLSTMGTRDCTRVVRLAWQASLLTEPPHWPETSLFLRKSKFALGSKHCLAASPSFSLPTLPPFD